jgi:hypothetical protein
MNSHLSTLDSAPESHAMSTLHTRVNLNADGIPSFDDLPLREGDPFHSAWGLYGDQDELGTLNRLTNERVATAAKGEIKTGARQAQHI